MAINIFSGGAGGRGRSRNTASSSTRAANAKAALARPAETSPSGSTAVGTSGTLAKVGNFVGKAAGIASKFLPGIGGTIAKGIAGIFNDPEWWQHVPGDAITLNAPLRLISDGNDVQVRVALVEISSFRLATDTVGEVMMCDDDMITQYLMPNIRKVVNAVPLQAAESYKTVLKTNATIYAIWRTLKKWDYLTKHGNTYIASMNDGMFPLFQVENSAQLQSAINRLEEHLRSHVRLPHTLCEYLAWRFGRIYKSNSSAKSAFIMYDAFPIEGSVDNLWSFIEARMSTVSSTPELQQANADLYNAYLDHDMMVEIRDETQGVYDVKEFLLRTNFDYARVTHTDEPMNNVFLDSGLDNQTTFMASTVSTTCGSNAALFPVRSVRFYVPEDPEVQYWLNYTSDDDVQVDGLEWYHRVLGVPYLQLGRTKAGDGSAASTQWGIANVFVEGISGGLKTLPVFDITTQWEGWLAKYEDGDKTKALHYSKWWTYHLAPVDFQVSGCMSFPDGVPSPLWVNDEEFNDRWDAVNKYLKQQAIALFATTLLKAADMYNKDINLEFMKRFVNRGGEPWGPYGDQPGINVDLTSLSMDMGQVQERILATEQVYAFANLVDDTRKTSMSYGKAEKLVARDTAELVEKLDVATPAT